MIGQTVSHYEIREQLGRGGMGVVYRAWDTRLDRWVALKFLPQHANEDPLARERFVREAKAASALEHPHICTIHEIGETDDGQLFICMAFYDGPNLRKALATGRITTSRGFEIARQLCGAIARAHDAGIVHRDLKPSNIMMTKQGDVAIVDFGLAKLAGEISLTQTGATLGTTAYMSPEQLQGKDLDFRTDLWSLGVIIYQLLTGKYPFNGDYDQALQRSILEDEPQPPSEVSPDLPQYIDAVMSRLLAKDREERFHSAGEISQVLRSLEQAEASEVPTQLQLPKTKKKRRFDPRLAWRPIVLLVLVVAVLTLGWLALQSDRESSATDIQTVAVMPFSNYTGDPSKTYISDGIAAALITALSELRGLRVVGRSEAWALRDRGHGARELGERLGADTLLEGAVQGAEESIEVTANLIDVGTGGLLWSETVEGSSDALPDLTRRIAQRLTDVLEVRLSERERRRLKRDPTQSFQAYDYYLRGQSFLTDRYAPENLDAAVELFRQAIRVDPGFALAHVALSETYWEIWFRDGDSAALEEARREAEIALDLDPELPAGLVALARVERAAGEIDDSIGALEDALKDHPDPAAAHRELALSYERAGDFESAERALRAATLVGAGDWKNWNLLGAFQWRMGRYEDARQSFETAIDLAPEDVHVPHRNLGGNEISLGNWEQAIEVLERIPRAHLSYSMASNLGTAYYFSARPDRLEKASEYYALAARLNPRSDQIRRNLADVYMELGELDRARAQYLEALRLVDEKLAADPEDWNLRLLRSFYAARASDCDEALDGLERLSSDLPQSGLTAHRRAYVYALCGEREEALEAIAEAIEMGVQPELLRAEPEFAALHDDPRFERLVGSDAGE
ncbi:MAG: protein kinase [Thermoanaerobaculia bacterium]|nr:protein kinase [Thermoanaerobaculia bacterium]